jgi:hypothetical protein
LAKHLNNWQFSSKNQLRTDNCVAGSLTFAIFFENHGYISKWALQIFWEPTGKWVYIWVDNYCWYVFSF